MLNYNKIKDFRNEKNLSEIMIILDFIKFLQTYSEIYSNLLNNFFVKYPKLLKIVEIYLNMNIYFIIVNCS